MLISGINSELNNSKHRNGQRLAIMHPPRYVKVAGVGNIQCIVKIMLPYYGNRKLSVSEKPSNASGKEIATKRLLLNC